MSSLCPEAEIKDAQGRRRAAAASSLIVEVERRFLTADGELPITCDDEALR
jgi:hypothetical protein